jgi:hypothetical protein
MSTSSHPLDTAIPDAAIRVSPQDPAVPAEVYAEVDGLGIGEQFPEVIALTRELFGDFRVDISVDPEIYNCTYVTFNIRAEDSYESAFEKESEWIRRLPRRPTQAPGSFCINVDFVKP